MAYIGMVESKTRAAALTDSASHTNKVYFPTDSDSIVKAGKEYGRSGGCTHVTTLVSVPQTNQKILCTYSSAATEAMTWAATPTEGVTYDVLIWNAASAASSVTLHQSGLQGSIMPIGSTFASASGKVQTSLTLSVSAQSGLLLHLTKFGNFIVVED